MDAKHTVGPWKAMGRNVLATQSMRGYICRCDTVTNGEHLANARLIASSPDLLSVLEEFVEDVETSYQHGDEFPDGDALEMLRVEWPDLAVTYEKAVKAIALAKGGK